MSLINTYYNNAELSVAAYADLAPGEPDTQELEDEDVGMSSAQAKEFAENWVVLDQQENTDSGFSATIFERLDDDGNPTGEYTMAIRGSEDPFGGGWSDWFGTNFPDIGGEGITIKQAIDLFNYYQRLTATGDKVIQYHFGLCHWFAIGFDEGEKGMLGISRWKYREKINTLPFHMVSGLCESPRRAA